MTTTKIISAIAFAGIVIGTFFTVGNVSQYIDLNSFIFVIGVGLIYAFAVSGEKSKIQKFGDGTVRAGWLGTLIGLVHIFGTAEFQSMNMEAIGSAMAIVLLTLLYGYFFKLGSMLLN